MKTLKRLWLWLRSLGKCRECGAELGTSLWCADCEEYREARR